MRAAITAAFAFGFNAGAPPQKQAAVTFADVPTFDAAINALVSKKVVSRATVDAMDEKAKSRAFYVSRLAELEAVGRVKDYLVDNLKDKTSFQNFVKNLDKDELLKKAGWEEDGGWYWETVYRTNTMSAFNAGRAEAFDEYEPEFLEFIGIEDFRQTPVCAARSGIVKKRTDPFWKKNFPPLHFNCRSTVRPVYAEEAAAFGIKESAEVSLPDAPTKGFGHNPAAEWDEVTEEVKERYGEFMRTSLDFHASKKTRSKNIQEEDLKNIHSVLIDNPNINGIWTMDMENENEIAFYNRKYGIIVFNGNRGEIVDLKNAAEKIKNKKATELTKKEYLALEALEHELTHDSFAINTIAKTEESKKEILTELYARTKIALRDEIKSNALRKQIVTESLGYTDLIQKDFLNESLLEYNKESVEKLNRALKKDLMKSAEGESVSMSNLAQFDHNLFAKLMGKVAFGGTQ